MAKAAYIHIPFCAHKCDFCDFAAFAGADELSHEYCTVLAREIHERLSKQPNDEQLTSLFYGGGTPGYIEPSELKRVHEAIKAAVGFTENAEITVETTPQSITAAKATQWLELGINRLSVGVQSFDDGELKAMGRDHSAAQAVAGLRVACEAGFKNISLDLMYGTPEQKLSTWQKTLETALSFGLPHMSAYGLTIANNSPLLQRYPRDSQAYPDEDAFVEMYKRLISSCAAAGLEHYEISNFARRGFQSLHNLAYWDNDEYLAFGVSAHRYVAGVRSSNLRALKKYMRDYLSDETHEVIDEKTRAKEAIFLGLRKRQGLNIEAFNRRYALDLSELLLSDKIQHLQTGGFLEIKDGWLRLTEDGILVSNSILAELI